MTYIQRPSFSALRVLAVLFFISCVIPLSGCDAVRNELKPDRSGNKEIQDYRDGLAPRLPEVDQDSAAANQAAIPDLQPYVAAPDNNYKAMPLVSVSVNQSVPLRDMLFELAQQANYDLELDPRITGSIIFTARERPFDEVIKRICDVAGLRYKFDDDVLRIELDTPYNKIYKIDYLSYVRSNKGSISNNIAVVTGDGADTGSQYKTTTDSEADFWGELEQNLKQILGGTESGALKTMHTPKVTATEQNPNVQAVAPVTTDKDGKVQVQPPQATLKVESLPVDEEESTTATSRDNGNANGATFTINKQAGLLNVYASEKLQKQVDEYLKVVKRSVTSQVLIEAKVLEVSLNDRFATGINWRLMNSGDVAVNFLNPARATLNNLTPNSAPAFTSDDGSTFVVGVAGDDIQALVQALSEFGTVKALASPRLTVLNNQSAVLNVATNHVYFDVDINVTTQDNLSQVDISSDPHNIPEGLLVNVQPSINLDNQTVSMAIRPTVTRIVSQVPDPAVQFVTAQNNISGVESLVPELNVQEIDSVIQARSGQPIIMGGLLQDRSETTESGIPVLSETPVLGSLFKQHSDTVAKTELVIFLKATILEAPDDSVDNTDKDIYRTFSEDRHPMKL